MPTQAMRDVFQSGPYFTTVITDHGHAQDNQLGMILGIDFRDRNIEIMTQSIENTTHHLTFVFQATRSPHQQPHDLTFDDHARTDTPRGVVGMKRIEPCLSVRSMPEMSYCT